jgi:hypothetical protein
MTAKTTTRPQLVSDEVWAQLDPRAGALSRADTRLITRLTALAVVVAAAAMALWVSGFVRANLSWSDSQGYGSSFNPHTHTFSTDVVVKNNGWTAVRVTGIGGDGAGLHLTGTTQPHISTDLGRTVPFTLEPGQTAILALDYQVTDCAAVTSGSFPVPVRVKRFWGTQTVSVGIATDLESTPSSARTVEWQRWLADQTCGIWTP